MHRPMLPDFWICGHLGCKPFGLLPLDEAEMQIERLKPQVGHRVNADESPAPFRFGVFRFRGVAIGPSNASIQVFACPPTPLPLAP